MPGVDGVQVRSGGQWQALLTYPGKLAIGATFDLAADQRGRITVMPYCFDDLRIPGLCTKNFRQD